jgi:hypothetical protein
MSDHFDSREKMGKMDEMDKMDKMEETEQSEKAERGTDGRYLPGWSGGPGRPRTRSRAASVLLKLADERAERIAEAVLKRAEEGEIQAARLVYSGQWAAPKDRTFTFPLPEVRKALDLPKLVDLFMRAVSRGELSPAEGLTLAAMANEHRRAFDAADFAARLEAIEQTKRSSDE